MRRALVLLLCVGAVVGFLGCKGGEAVKKTQWIKRPVEIKGYGYGTHGEKMKAEIKANGQSKESLGIQSGGKIFSYRKGDKGVVFTPGKMTEYEGRKPYSLEAHKKGKLLEVLSIQTARVQVAVRDDRELMLRKVKISAPDLDTAIARGAEKVVKEVVDMKYKNQAEVTVKGRVYLSDLVVKHKADGVEADIAFSLIIDN